MIVDVYESFDFVHRLPSEISIFTRYHRVSRIEENPLSLDPQQTK